MPDFVAQKNLLTQLLSDDNPDVSTQASLSLAAVEVTENLGALLKRISSQDPTERVQAVYTLRLVIGDEARKLLAQLVQHPIVDIRAAALRVIGERKDQRLVKAVLDKIKDKDEAVAQTAVSVLIELGDRRVVDTMQAALREVSDNVKASIVVALAALEAPNIGQLLSKAAKAPNPRIRAAAAEALGKILLDGNQTDA